MTGEAEPVGFIGRWSRRKRGLEAAAEAEAEATGTAVEQPAEDAPPPAAACPVPGLPELDLSALPSIEELTVSSDLAPFLRPGIPATLRAAALRRMWSLDPEIRDFIGCVEYQWDFNTPGGLPNGFSAELGGDIGKLLDQAIGALQDKPAAEPEAATPVELEPPPASLVVQAPEAELALTPPADPPPEPAPAPLRRHGGALPV